MNKLRQVYAPEKHNAENINLDIDNIFNDDWIQWDKHIPEK